ncbi:MAG TPA: hypothetical protein VLI04_20965 [Nocardioidaceae bacterium]|nr:hypothetical protein [Nocardioidaceae bacterium]
MKVSILTASLAACILAGCTDEGNATTDPPECLVLTDDDANPDQIKGEPGCYVITARGSARPALAALDVPAGYTNFGAGGLWPVDVSGEAAPFRGIQYWTVYGVYANPCAEPIPAPAVGPSVEDLAAALTTQKLTRASTPRPVTLDGHDGLYLELTVPLDTVFDNCAEGYYKFWEGMPGDAQHTAESPGILERTWILDVDGDRVVLNVMASPGVTDAEIDELTEVVESVRFVEP